jgi:hypothetical protein
MVLLCIGIPLRELSYTMHWPFVEGVELHRSELGLFDAK